jgi:hypothetical protein
MSPHPYTEDQLVEQPAIALLAELGWTTVNGLDEVLGLEGTFGRETRSEVFLGAQLRAALVRLNPDVPPEGITAAIDQLIADRSAMSLAAANREVYFLLKEGVPVSVPDPERGGQRTLRLRVIDWQNVANNDFLCVSQFTITGSLYTCRLDLVGFVNGLPLMVIELKKPGVPAKQAFDENSTSYKHEQNGVPPLFWYNAFVIASNGTESRVGSLTADWERFFEWKRVEREDEPRRVSLEVMLRGVAEPRRLLDLLENFAIFSEHKTGYVKILAQNHQFLGVNNAIASMLQARRAGHGRAGVFWQTQGSGKSLSMVFFAQKVLRRVPGNWTFVVTDRTELDDQIARTFKETGAVSEADSKSCHAGTGAHLGQLLTENHRYVFTLIHKFQTPELLSIARDIVQHFLGRGFQGKAMVVSIDKATALRMHDKVQGYWKDERSRVEKELAKAESYDSRADLGDVAELRERLHVLTTTDMALVVSPAQNEIEQMRRLGLDIAPHRKRMNEEALDDKFKDPDDPLRLVFVCAMWLTLTRVLTDEQQRHVREQLTEEELTVFDLLTRPGPELTTEERDEVKKVARHLLEQVRAALVLNWRLKAQARARVKLVIEDTLDEGRVTPGARMVILIVALVTACGLSFVLTGTLVPNSAADALIFQSTLLFVVLGSAVLEHKFTRPADSVVNGLIGMISLITVANIAPPRAWWAVFGYCAAVFLMALICSVASTGPSIADWRRRIATATYRPAVVFGKARLLYSVVFLFAVVTFYGVQDTRTATLIVFWGLFLALWPLGVPEMLSAFQVRKSGPSPIGRAVRFDSPNLVRVELDPAQARTADNPALLQAADGKQQIVVPLYAQLRGEHLLATGLCVPASSPQGGALTPGHVYPLASLGSDSVAEKLGGKGTSALIGFVIEDSSIGQIRFETWRQDLCRDGLVVWCSVAGQRVFYQITEGATHEEVLEGDRHGFQYAVAGQLGAIDNAAGFVRNPWVPLMNTPVFWDSDIAESPSVQKGDFVYGTLPGTKVPIAGPFVEAMDHHTAILGVTGTGKTELAFDLMRHALTNVCKVICIDLTDRYRERIDDLKPVDLSISAALADDLGKKLFDAETGAYGAGQEKKALKSFADKLRTDVAGQLKTFLVSKNTRFRPTPPNGDLRKPQ